MGLYELRILCFGLTKAADTFQNAVLKDVIKSLLVYLDVNVTFIRSKAEHYKHLGIKLQLPWNHKLCDHLGKCNFVQPELQFLGHSVGSRGRCVPGSTRREAASQSYGNTDLASLNVADPLSRHPTFTATSMSLAVTADTDLAVWGPEYSHCCRSQHKQACQSVP